MHVLSGGQDLVVLVRVRVDSFPHSFRPNASVTSIFKLPSHGRAVWQKFGILQLEYVNQRFSLCHILLCCPNNNPTTLQVRILLDVVVCPCHLLVCANPDSLWPVFQYVWTWETLRNYFSTQPWNMSKQLEWWSETNQRKPHNYRLIGGTTYDAKENCDVLLVWLKKFELRQENVSLCRSWTTTKQKTPFPWGGYRGKGLTTRSDTFATSVKHAIVI